MFDSSDVQSVFSGNIAEEWEKKSRYINSLKKGDWTKKKLSLCRKC